MEKLTFTNSNGESLIVATNSAVNRIQRFIKSPVKYKAQTSKGYQQDGYTYRDAFAEPRNLALSFVNFGSGYSDLFGNQEDIKSVLNPELGEITLKYENGAVTREMTVVIDETPEFPTGKKNFGYNYQICGVSMTAYNPFLRDLAYTYVDLISLSDPFYWDTPEYFEEATPFYLGAVGSGSKTIPNIGHVPCGVTLEWVGAATNPKITLEDTGQYIKLLKTLGADEKLIITTGYGEKNVLLEVISTGAVSDGFSYVDDENSEFFLLPPGNSTISLSADSGSGSAAVSVKYKNLYV